MMKGGVEGCQNFEEQGEISIDRYVQLHINICMQNTFLTEVQITALSGILDEIPSQHMKELISPTQQIRVRAYHAIQAILREKMQWDEETHKELPLFLAESGDTLSAISYMITTIELHEIAPPEKIIAILRQSCQNYARTFDRVESMRNESEPWNEDVRTFERNLQTTKQKISKLLWLAWLQGGDYFRIRAEYAYKVEKNKKKALQYYEKMLEESSSDDAAQDFLVVGDLYREMGDMRKGVEIYVAGFQKTQDITLFEYCVRYGMLLTGEEQAKIFFRQFRPIEYALPFSYLRGRLAIEDELPDIAKMTRVLFSGGSSDMYQSAYIRNISQYLDRGIETMKGVLTNLEKDGPEDTATRIEMRNIAATDYLELLEYQIFYLLEFKNLKEYIFLIKWQLSLEKWASFMSLYFSEHTLPALSGYFDEDTMMSRGSSSEDISEESSESPFPELANIHAWYFDAEAMATYGKSASEDISHQSSEDFSLEGISAHTRHEILKRYGYLQLRIASHTDFHTNIDSRDARESPSSLREELILMSAHIRVLFPEEDYWLATHVLEWKVRREERNLEHAGPEAQQDYYDIIEEIDTTYSVTERRYLSYHARWEDFIWRNLPAMCQNDSLLAMFFVSERLLAWYGSQFEDALHEIIAGYKLRELPMIHALTFAEILISYGHEEEAFFFLLYFEGSFLDVDAILLLSQLFSHADESSGELQEWRNLLEDRAIRFYGKDCFENLLLEITEFQWEGLLELESSEEISDVDEHEAQKKWVAIMAYALGIFLEEDNPEESERYITQSSSLWLYEAYYHRVRRDLNTKGYDRENIFSGLLDAFEKSEYPVRGLLIIEILSLAIEFSERDIMQRYQEIAHMEWVDVGTLSLRYMLQHDEDRTGLYTFLLSSDRVIDFLPEDLILLQSVMDRDVRTLSIPLDIKLRASYLKSTISSHKEYGLMPATLEHWMCISENFDVIHSAVFLDTYTTLVQEFFPEFDSTAPDNLTFENAFNFHISQSARVFREETLRARNDDTRVAWLIYYGMFIQCIVVMLARLPQMENIRLILKDWEKMYQTSAMDYWIQEQEKNTVHIHNLQNKENPLISYTSYLHNPENISHFPIHSIIQ